MNQSSKEQRWARALRVMAFCIALPISSLPWSSASAQTLAGLEISGYFVPGTSGALPLKATYSWIKTTTYYGGYFTWRYGPGFDKGIVFGVAQDYGVPRDAGSMTSWFMMLTRDSWLYSANDGIAIDAAHTIDMSNLRLYTGGDLIDLSDGGVNTLVPLVPDIAVLAEGENGWMINPDGSYHLIYYNSTTGACGAGCATAIHLYGALRFVSNAPDGDLNVDGKVDDADVLLALRIRNGDLSPSPEQIRHADVAPLQNGTPAPDGSFDLDDVLLIIRKATGSLEF